jgi:hypothetical protein
MTDNRKWYQTELAALGLLFLVVGSLVFAFYLAAKGSGL